MYGAIKESEINWVLKGIEKRSCLLGLYLLINEEVLGFCKGCNKKDVLESIIKIKKKNEKLYKKIKNKYFEMNEFKNRSLLGLIINLMRYNEVIDEINLEKIEKEKMKFKKRYKIPELNDIIDKLPEIERRKIIKEKSEKIKINQWREENENRKGKNK